MLDHFMLNGNLLRNSRWECRQNTKQHEIGIDLKNRLREVISPSVKLFSYRNRVARSLFTTSKKKQIAFIISQICLLTCIFLLLVNLPPIVNEILTAEDILVLGTRIITLFVYIVVLGFLFFMLFSIWRSVILKYRDRFDIQKYLRLKIDPRTGEATYDGKPLPLEREEAKKSKIEFLDEEEPLEGVNTTANTPKMESDTYYIIPLKFDPLAERDQEGEIENEQEDTNSKGEVL